MQTELINELEATGKDLQDTLAAFKQADFNTVPFEGSWTPGQVADHIHKSVSTFSGAIKGSTKPTERAPDQNIPFIKGIFLDFSTKLQSPDFIIPGNGPFDKEQMAATLKETMADIADTVKKVDLSLTCTSFELPHSGHPTRIEALAFVVYHTQRHIHQLNNML